MIVEDGPEPPPQGPMAMMEVVVCFVFVFGSTSVPFAFEAYRKVNVVNLCELCERCDAKG